MAENQDNESGSSSEETVTDDESSDNASQRQPTGKDTDRRKKTSKKDKRVFFKDVSCSMSDFMLMSDEPSLWIQVLRVGGALLGAFLLPLVYPISPDLRNELSKSIQKEYGGGEGKDAAEPRKGKGTGKKKKKGKLCNLL